MEKNTITIKVESRFEESDEKLGACSLCGDVIYGKCFRLKAFLGDLPPEHLSVALCESCHGIIKPKHQIPEP